MTDPLVTRARELLAAATPGPWFYNSYSSVFSQAVCFEHDAAEALIPDDAPDDDPRWAALPEPIVATVEVLSGDTATEQGRKNARLIAEACSPEGGLLAQLADRVESLESELSFLRAGIAEPGSIVADLRAERDAARAECERLRALCGEAANTLRDAPGLDHITACEKWDGQHSCDDRMDELLCDPCIARHEVAAVSGHLRAASEGR